MIIQIDALFINTDTITTISPYSREVSVNDVESIEAGIIINGIKYGLDVVPKDSEEVTKIRTKAAQVVNTIVNSITVHAVQKLNLGEKDA